MNQAGRKVRSPVHGLFLLLFLVQAACTEQNAFEPPDIPSGDYRRIVSLTPSVTEILFAIGAGDRVKGVTKWCDYPPEAARLPRVGDFVLPDLETLLVLEPDLVILAPTGHLLRASYDSLVELGLPVLVVWNNTIAETLQAVRTIGSTIRLDREGESLAAELADGLERERSRLSGARPQKVLWLMGRNPLIAVGEETFQQELLDAAGAENAAAGLGRWPSVTLEFVLKADPDVIIDSSMDRSGAKDDSSAVSFWESFPTMKAVRTGRVVALRHDSLYRPGPRMVKAMRILGQVLAPDLYENE